MNLLLLSIPTEHNALVAWLERHVAGLNLGQLVAELSVIHGNSHEISLEAICREQLSEVFESGLSVLTVDQISQLLTNPMSLLELQEQAFVAGSLYWEQVTAETGAGRVAATMNAAVLAEIRRIDSKTISGTDSTTKPELSLTDGTATERLESMLHSVAPPPVGHSEPKGFVRTALIRNAIWLASAAAILAMIFQNSFNATTSGWGFDRPEALTVQMAEPEFFQHLSSSANEWFNKQPASPAELEKRLVEFSHGCQTLLEAPLPQLDEASREWLRIKCRSWKTAVDSSIVRIKQQPEDFDSVLTESNSLIKQLVVALRTGGSA